MRAADRHRLLFGPYRSPRLRVGARAFCILRDCECVVTTLSDGRIPWPRGRPLDAPLGGSGLLLLGGLVEAVKRESAAAVGYWFGVSEGVVWRWRKALGVTRTNNPGSRRLVRAASAEGGAASRERGVTDEEREHRRRVAKRLKLGRNLIPGYHGPWWTRA